MTAVPTGEDLSSLSAILLDDGIYAWLRSGRRTIAEVSIVGAPHLIALKMRAFLDLHDRRLAGEPVDARDMRKHRSDVLRLLKVVTAEPLVDVPQAIRDDAVRFAAMAREDAPDVRNLGLVLGSLEAALTVLEVLFGLGS